MLEQLFGSRQGPRSQLADLLARGRQRQARRQAVIEAYGSPLFTWKCGVLPVRASETFAVISEFAEARKYTPLNWMQITNIASYDVEVNVNNGEFVQLVPSGVIKLIEDDIHAIYQVKVTNQSWASGITQDAVIIDLKRRAMTIDTYIRARVSDEI